MILVRFLAAILASALTVAAGAQPTVSAIQLEPLEDGRVHVTNVQNHYGKCGEAVVQIIGVETNVGEFFVSDPNGESRITIIRDAGRRELTLERELDYYTGAACVTNRAKKYLLVWTNCGGTACAGIGWRFTVVDVDIPQIVAGGDGNCDEMCAYRMTNSRIPLLMNAE